MGASERHHAAIMALSEPESMSHFEGNPDLYGVGVRIGLYSQWIATLLVTLFDPANEAPQRVANLIIQSAIFLGLCIESSHKTDAVGALITQFLLCGSLSSLTGDGIGHLGHLSGIMRVLFYTALSSYGCWFWFAGIEAMLKPHYPNIGFFGRSRIDGWFRTFGKAIAIAGVIVCVCLIGVCVWAAIRRFSHGFERAVIRKKKTRPQVEIGLLFLSMGLIALSIAAVEYLIQVNGITGLSELDSVGQLIPLLVGGISCAVTTWKIMTRRLFLKRRCWFIFGHHLWLKGPK